MSIEPKPGLVIRYDFLWKEESLAGVEQGRKDRPCAIILTTKPKDDGSMDVVLCPITHSPIQDGETGLEIPVKLVRHLRLDGECSFIKTHQVNTLNWPPSRLPYGVSLAFKNQWSFGILPQSFAIQVFEQVKTNSKNKRLMNTLRKDE